MFRRKRKPQSSVVGATTAAVTAAEREARVRLGNLTARRAVITQEIDALETLLSVLSPAVSAIANAPIALEGAIAKLDSKAYHPADAVAAAIAAEVPSVPVIPPDFTPFSPGDVVPAGRVTVLTASGEYTDEAETFVWDSTAFGGLTPVAYKKV